MSVDKITAVRPRRVGRIALYNSDDDTHRAHVLDYETRSFEPNRGVDMPLIRGMYLYHIIALEGSYSLQRDGGKEPSRIGWYDTVQDLLNAMSEHLWGKRCNAIFLLESPQPVSYVYTDLL